MPSYSRECLNSFASDQGRIGSGLGQTTNVVRKREICRRSLLRASVGDCPQQSVAAQEREHCQRYEIPDGFEHVQLEPEHTEQGKDRPQAQVETERTEREGEVADVDPQFGPQQEQQDQWGDTEPGE